MYPPQEQELNPELMVEEIQEDIPVVDEGVLAGLEAEAPEPLGETASDFDKETIKDAFKTLMQDYIQDERDVRYNQLKIARRNNAYWANRQNIWYDDVAHDWRTFDNPPEGYDEYSFTEYQDFKFANLYKAYGESIIASVSAQVPTTRFFPEDAENAKDVQAAKAYTGLAEILRKNDASKLLMVKILRILFNEHFIAIHNYVERSDKYGTVEVPRHGLVSIKFTKDYCPNCGGEISSEEGEPEEVIPGQEMLQGTDLAEEEKYCEKCNSVVNPFRDVSYDKREGIVDYDVIERIKIKRDAYGILNVGFPTYCKTWEQVPCLWLDLEISQAQALEECPGLREIITEHTNANIFPNDDQYARIAFDYIGEIPKYTVTKRQMWFRPWALNRIEDDSLREVLRNKFPQGVKLTFYNEHLVYADADDLDDAWSVSVNPQYNELVAEPMGNIAIPLQDIENNVLNLTEDTIEHGIGETFASQSILDLERYAERQARPGQLTPVKDPGNQNLGGYFHQLKTATMSPEIGAFSDKVDGLLQLVLGAFPSIFGGQMPGGSNTLGEYQESRTQALQRLQLMWGMTCTLWSDMEFKSIRNYARELNYDDKFVEKAGSGYRNIWIKQVDLEGTVNNIEPETAEYFPINWAQKKNVIDGLMQQKSPVIDGILSDPNNIKNIASAYGMADIYIPGDDDRNKQIYETAQLINSVPTVSPDGMTVIPSVEPEFDVDNHAVHIATCKSWAVSDIGQACKAENPEGYQNVLAHMKMHQDMEMAQMQEEMQKQMMMSGGMMGPPQGDPNAGNAE